MSNRGNQSKHMPAPKAQEDKDEAALLAQAEKEAEEAGEIDPELSEGEESEEGEEEQSLSPEEAKVQKEMEAKQKLQPKYSRVIGKPEAKEPVKSVAGKKGPFRVVALRDGFIYNSRKKEGDIFTVQTEREIGKWMKVL